jgi:hypothetical protein
LPGKSNVVRAIGFADAVSGGGPLMDLVTVLSFEVDDQTPEDLAQGLQRLRALEAVLDVIQHSVTAMKSRLAMGVQVLARPSSAESVAKECFVQTSTLGIRMQIVQRHVLPRVESGPVQGFVLRSSSGRRAFRPRPISTMSNRGHAERDAGQVEMFHALSPAVPAAGTKRAGL